MHPTFSRGSRRGDGLRCPEKAAPGPHGSGHGFGSSRESVRPGDSEQCSTLLVTEEECFILFRTLGTHVVPGAD